MISVPSVTLINGTKIPILGLGTWKATRDTVRRAVKEAIRLGYRHFDCAYFYQNEHDIGQALSEAMVDGNLRRKDLYLTSKLWNTFHKPELVEPAIKRSLDALRTDYLDLYLIHWPMAYLEGEDLVPMKCDRVLISDTAFTDTWQAMEELVKMNLAKSIGLANFNRKQTQKILRIATVAPVMNQIECHPFLNQTPLIEFCRERGIAITCHSPLGSGESPWAQAKDRKLLKNERLVALGERHNKSPAQIALRYQIQRGNIVIPKSVNKKRLKQNISVFDFALSDNEMKVVNCINNGTRFVALNGVCDHPDHPFANDLY